MSCRVLFVDDEDLVCRAFARSMSRRGIDVVAATSGAQALDHALHQAFDVVVTDLSMPRLDGLSLIAELYRQRPQLRFVLLTGYAEELARREYRRAEPVVHFVRKPWDDGRIASLLQSLAAEAA